MTTQILPLTAFGPLLLVAAALLTRVRPGPRLAETAALCALALSLAGAVQLMTGGAQALALLPGVGLTLDAIGVTMAVLVAFVGWIVLRYCRTYLHGEARAPRAQAGILIVLVAVLVLVQAGDLALMAVCTMVIGAAMRDLLLFYPDRPAARRAAAKFVRVWGAGDVALVLAAVLRGSPSARPIWPR